MEIDCGFAGGNIVVDSIDGDNACVHQDLRDTEGDWFYFCFRVRGAAGRTISVRFTKSAILGVRGPALSLDGGSTWRWLGAEHMTGNAAFTCAVPADAPEARFSFGMPYLETNLRRFLDRHARNANLQVSALCQTAKGRTAELLQIGNPDSAQHRVLITCRHHCCEMMASYAVEGIVDAALAEDDLGRWFRQNVALLSVPFADKDGVEDGDQGKNRRPHDHNRDYADEHSLYPTVRAVKQLVRERLQSRLTMSFDLHCPWIRGEHNEDIYFVGGRNAEIWQRVGAYSKILESSCRGPLPFSARHNLPFGQAWNTSSGPHKSSSRWLSELPGVLIATGMEIPYANASGRVVDADSARAFGVDLATAIAKYLQRNS
jgi:hypothetical protein